MRQDEPARVQCNNCGKWLPAVPPVCCCGFVIFDEIRKKDKMGRLKWYLKQLLPLVYLSTFTSNGKRQLCIWRMWFGHLFNVRWFDLA